MKKGRLQFFVLFLLAAMLGGCKKKYNTAVTVIRDCTGTYLRYNNKDYHVCNIEKVSSYSDGAKLIATFKRLAECKGSAIFESACEMYHANEGWIEVNHVK